MNLAQDIVLIELKTDKFSKQVLRYWNQKNQTQIQTRT